MQEKKIKIGKLEVNYKEFGDSTQNEHIILILHGWGGSSESWEQVGERLEVYGYRTIVPDLPGFGKTKLTQTMTLEEYAIVVENFLSEILPAENSNIILWGHSNGGAIAMKVSLRNKLPIQTLVLNNSAGIRNDTKRSLKRKIFQSLSKKIKLLLNHSQKNKFLSKLRTLFYRAIGGQDYLNAEKNPQLKQTYLNMIHSDLREEMKKIEHNTLLIWGEKDTYTPLSDGMYMRNNITKSKMEIIENEKHGIHLHAPEKLVQAFIHNI